VKTSHTITAALLVTAMLPAAAQAANDPPAGDPAAARTASKPKRKNVKVGDNFFSPKKLKVAKNTTIVWKWSSANGDSHDVYLSKRPKGVKRFHSDPAATDFSYKKKLKRPGKYKILCTLHEEMVQTITVKE
jgi:plastocyanin